MNGYFLRGSNSVLLLKEQVLSNMSSPHFGRAMLTHTEKQTESIKRCSLAKVTLKYGCIPIYLNLLHSERPKLYTILAFLSAVGLISVFYSRL